MINQKLFFKLYFHLSHSAQGPYVVELGLVVGKASA